MIPTYEEIMLPFLKYLEDGEDHNLNEAHDTLAEKFKWNEMAISHYEKAIALNPHDVHLYLSVGHIHQYELNDKKKAIEVYNRGLSYAQPIME